MLLALSLFLCIGTQPARAQGGVIVQQTRVDASVTARGVCQSFTGLSGDLAQIELRVRFLQPNSEFYPASPDIGIFGLDIGVVATANCRHDYLSLVPGGGRRNDGRPLAISGYDPNNTTDFQSVVFTFIDAAGQPSPIPLDPANIYELYFGLQNSTQRFEIQGASDSSAYPDGQANFIFPFTPYQPGAVKDIYFTLETETPQFPLIKQGDPHWADDPYPPYKPGETIDTLGCALCCMAMVARSYGVDTDPDGNPLDPHYLNLWMAAHDDSNGYAKDGNVAWRLMGTYTGGRVQYLGQSDDTLSGIEADLAAGNLVVLRVKIQTHLRQGHFGSC